MRILFYLMLTCSLFFSCESDHKKDGLFSPDKIASQFFTIYVGHDTTIISKGGVVIEVFANAFKQADSKGEVILELKEVLNKSDIIRGGLHTLSNEGQLLESGGMIFMDVKPRQEINGQEINVKIPTKGINPKMQLFRLEESGDIESGWKVASNLPKSLTTQSIEEGKKLFQDHCESCHSANLREDYTGPALGNIHLFRSKDWFIDFTKNPTGMIVGGDSLSICIWNGWKPVMMQNFDTVLTKNQIENIYLFLSNESAIQSIDSNEVEYVLKCRMEIIGDTSQDFSYRYIKITNQDTTQIEFRNRKENLETVFYYEFEVNSFGWANIDYFLREDSNNVKELDPIKVEIEMPIPSAEYTVLMVFKNRNIVIPLTKSGNTFTVMGKDKIFLPQNEEVYLVGIGKSDDYWLGTKTIKTGGKNNHQLKLNKSGKAEIDAFIETL